jgi:hypothetical protein
MAPALTVWEMITEYRVLVDLALAYHLMMVDCMILYIIAWGRSSGRRGYLGSGVCWSLINMSVFRHGYVITRKLGLMASKWWQSRGSQVELEHWTLVHSRGRADFTVFIRGSKA